MAFQALREERWTNQSWVNEGPRGGNERLERMRDSSARRPKHPVRLRLTEGGNERRSNESSGPGGGRRVAGRGGRSAIGGRQRGARTKADGDRKLEGSC